MGNAHGRSIEAKSKSSNQFCYFRRLYLSIHKFLKRSFCDHFLGTYGLKNVQSWSVKTRKITAFLLLRDKYLIREPWPLGKYLWKPCECKYRVQIWDSCFENYLLSSVLCYPFRLCVKKCTQDGICSRGSSNLLCEFVQAITCVGYHPYSKVLWLRVFCEAVSVWKLPAVRLWASQLHFLVMNNHEEIFCCCYKRLCLPNLVWAGLVVLAIFVWADWSGFGCFFSWTSVTRKIMWFQWN